MSLFLAPIHDLMYKKIHIQDEYATKLLTSLREDKLQLLNDRAEETEKGNLADVIDTTNIHGWLANQVSISEERFAEAVSILLNEGLSEEELINKMEELGKEKSSSIALTAQEAFQMMNQMFLDGMPCDHINSVLDRGDDFLTFTRSANVHEMYFKKRNLNPDLYFKLRDAYLKGMLDESLIQYTENKDSEDKSVITLKREAQNV